MLCLNISNITIITVKNVDYCCIIHNITKSEAIDLLESVVLEKCIYKNIVLIFCLVFLFFLFFLFCLVYIKWLIVWTSISL